MDDLAARSPMRLTMVMAGESPTMSAKLVSQRAEDRVGEEVVVLVETEEDDENDCVGRAAHQAPEVDGECVVTNADGLRVGDLVRCRVDSSEGVDLVVTAIEVLPR